MKVQVKMLTGPNTIKWAVNTTHLFIVSSHTLLPTLSIQFSIIAIFQYLRDLTCITNHVITTTATFVDHPHVSHNNGNSVHHIKPRNSINSRWGWRQEGHPATKHPLKHQYMPHRLTHENAWYGWVAYLGNRLTRTVVRKNDVKLWWWWCRWM